MTPPLVTSAAVDRSAGATDPDRLLVRAIGTRQLTALIFSYTVGSGIFALPAVAVANLGSAAPLAYLVCAALMALIVLVFAQAGSRVTSTGGPYAYVGVALGPFCGLVVALLNILSDSAAAGAVSHLLATSVIRLVGLESALWQPAIIATVVFGLSALNIVGVRRGVGIVEVFAAAKLLPLAGFVTLGAFFIAPSNLRIDALPSAGSVATTSTALIFMFTGLESALVPSGEIRDPARTLPRAAMLGLGAATLLYLAVQLVAQGVMGPALGRDTLSPLAHAARVFAGDRGYEAMLAAAAISSFGWFPGTILSNPRALFALARDGYLPRRLAAVHPRFATPHIAIGTYAIFILGLALTGTFEGLVVLSAIASLTVYLLCSIAAGVLERRDVRGEGEPFRAPGGAIVPGLACLVVVWLAIETVGASDLTALLIVLAAAAVFHAVRARRVRVATP